MWKNSSGKPLGPGVFFTGSIFKQYIQVFNRTIQISYFFLSPTVTWNLTILFKLLNNQCEVFVILIIVGYRWGSF